jgi:tetratricopeptide (TPR) repeat protein
VRWLRVAADAGHVAAVADLSSLAWGYYVWLDPALIRYVRMTADAGDLVAAYRLGQRVAHGFTGPDAESSLTAHEAQGYLRQAADSGHRAAARMLGTFLANSDARPRDGERYFAQSARSGDQTRDAEHYLRLVTDPENPDPAIAKAYPDRLHIGRWENAHRPTKLAEVELARLLRRTRRNEEATAYYERALQQPVRGDDYANWARELAQILEATGHPRDARTLRKKALDVERKWDALP